MAFQLVHYSQQDPKWKQDILGFGDNSDTIGYVGCALTSVAMLISGHGYTETPKTLNQKLKNVSGFVSAGIRWDTVSQIYPQVNVKSNISCANTAAPLDLIDASINAGQPVIVMVDNSPANGLQTHWVVLYKKDGNDYLMLDPWPHPTESNKKISLMSRYSHGKTLQQAILHVIVYQAFGASGSVSTPSQPATGTTSTSTSSARVKTEVTLGLNIRSSIDTSSMANIIATAPAGTTLTIVESDGISKIGAVNQWVRVRDAQGREGFAAAWYLEKVQVASPAPVPAPVPSPVTETPPPTTPTSTPASAPAPVPKKPKLIVIVKSAGAKVYKTASSKGQVLSTEKSKAQLVVVESADKAAAKIGVAGKWINVKGTNGKRGYVDGGLVKKG